jgi:PAS domain S-box-containing protein
MLIGEPWGRYRPMWQRLVMFLSPPQVKDAERSAQARLLHVALLATVVGAIPIAVLNAGQGATDFALALISLAAISLVGVVLNHRDRTQLAAGFLSAMLFLATIYTIVDGAGLYDAGLLALPIIITLVAFFFGRGAAWISAAISGVTLIGLALAGAAGWIGGALSEPLSTTQLAVCVILLLAFGALVHVVSVAWTTSLLAVRDSTARMELAFHGAGMGIWDLDIPEGRLEFDEAIGRNFGWGAATPMTMDAWINRLHPRDRDQVVTGLEEYLANGKGSWSAEYRAAGPGGDWTWRLASGRIAEWDNSGQPKRLLGVVIDVSEIKQAQLALLDSERRYRLLTQELHDSVTQTIYSMTLSLKAVRQLMDKDPARAAILLAELDELGREALGQMRAMLSQSRPEVLEERGLVAAIQDHITALKSRSGLDVNLDIVGNQPLAVGTELALFRVTQEALNNVVKHAGETSVSVRLDLNKEAARLHIVDHGKGFDTVQASKRQDAFGLGNMRQRIETLGGTLAINSAPGEGTQLMAQIPLAQPDGDALA